MTVEVAEKPAGEFGVQCDCGAFLPLPIHDAFGFTQGTKKRLTKAGWTTRLTFGKGIAVKCPTCQGKAKP